MSILSSILKGAVKSILIEILDESVKQNKITEKQRDLIIEVGAEIGKIKLKK